MAEDNSPPPADEISPKMRKRLDDLFKYGTDKLATGDHDYAHSMYVQCVAKDPASLKYVEAMLSNLNTKWASKKGKCRVKESRSEFKKAMAEKDWKAAFKLGPALLKDNPWDVPTLRELAKACEANHYNEVELHYLKNALDANAKDVDVNRHCAAALTRMGQFDQAIACWARVEEKVKKEAHKQINELQMAKNRRAAGIADDDSGGVAARAPDPATASAATAAASAASTGAAAKPVTDDDQPPTKSELEEAVVKSPEEIKNYLALAELHTAENEHRDAERVLRRALPVSGGSLSVTEELEKTQIRRSRFELSELRQKIKDNPSDELNEKLAKAKRQNLRLELDVYGARAERYPEDLRWKFEVGNRMKKLGNYEEAVPYFEAAKDDPKQKTLSLLSRGECLQQMKQYTAALKSYEEAVSEAEERPAGTTSEVLHLALYRAGTLAIGLKDAVRAKNWLKKLLEIAPGYRDAAARLDKLA